MSNLIKHDLDDDTVKWTEHELQVAVVTRLKQLGVLYAADQSIKWCPSERFSYSKLAILI